MGSNFISQVKDRKKKEENIQQTVSVSVIWLFTGNEICLINKKFAPIVDQKLVQRMI